MTSQEFEARIVGWAKDQPEVEALVQIGSRAQPNAEVDQWSDWDYHLIVRKAAPFQSTQWLSGIAPLWSAHIERTERGVAKLSAVFVGGYEVDFVPLVSWQMKLVYWAMARPNLKALFPRNLIKGIANTQLIVRPGYKVQVGGSAWEERLTALRTDWPRGELSSSDFDGLVSGFWRHAVWVQRKIMRGEVRAAQRWLFREVMERNWLLLEEEARLAGKMSRPEARKAEQWLDAKRVAQTAISSGPDQRVLARALLAEIALCEEISRSVAASRGFSLPDHSAVAEWLETELIKLSESA